jgi:hypothetical protein
MHDLVYEKGEEEVTPDGVLKFFKFSVLNLSSFQ